MLSPQALARLPDANSGQVDFEEVRKECDVCSRGAAYVCSFRGSECASVFNITLLTQQKCKAIRAYDEGAWHLSVHFQYP